MSIIVTTCIIPLEGCPVYVGAFSEYRSGAVFGVSVFRSDSLNVGAVYSDCKSVLCLLERRIDVEQDVCVL